MLIDLFTVIKKYCTPESVVIKTCAFLMELLSYNWFKNQYDLLNKEYALFVIRLETPVTASVRVLS